jgi:hypothetical protein
VKEQEDRQHAVDHFRSDIRQEAGDAEAPDDRAHLPDAVYVRPRGRAAVIRSTQSSLYMLLSFFFFVNPHDAARRASQPTNIAAGTSARGILSAG